MIAPIAVTVKKRKALRSILLIFVLLFSVCLLCGRLFFLKKTFFIVNSSSMEPEYPVGTFVVAKKTPFESIAVGEVIVFKSEALSGGLALHRVIRITEEGVYTKGDMNNLEDNQVIAADSYVAKGIFKSYAIGRFILVIRNPFGFTVFLVLPCLAGILLYQLLKLLKSTKKSI